MSSKFGQIRLLVPMATDRVTMEKTGLPLFMPPTLKKLMGHIAFGACVRTCVRAWVRASHFLYLL